MKTTQRCLAKFIVVMLGMMSPGIAIAQRADPWVTAWATSQQAVSSGQINNATIRMIARITIPGDSVRIRLDNTFGPTPATFGKASVGLRTRGPAVAEGMLKPLTFNGADSVTVAAGRSVVSDPVALHVEAQQDLAISLFVTSAEAQPSQHSNAYVTSYLTANGAGDQTRSEDGKTFSRTTTAMFWLKSVDVRPASGSNASAVVAFGDSITDGTCSTLDAHDRWQDMVARRFAFQNRAARAVLNEGIGGNTISTNVQPSADSPAGLDRLDRDVLSHAGVSHVMLFMGTNDIRREASAAQVIDGMSTIVARLKSNNLRIIGTTIIPRHNRAPEPGNTGWDDEKTRVKHEVNDWIRQHKAFDGVVDFDKIVRDSANPNLLRPDYNCGDGIHPSPAGYFQMGRSVDLALFGSP